MDGETTFDAWLDHLFGAAAEHLEPWERGLLGRLFEDTREQLNDFGFGFQPLLPDDDQPLNERANALADWCRGFLLGFGYAGQESQTPGACAEILRDFAEISRLDPDASGEAAEVAYAELTEYVRVGVQLVRGELARPAGTPLH